MPYIDVKISKKLSEEEKTGLKAKLGELIAIIPGKHEGVMMVGISDGISMYFGGKEGNTAFVEVLTYKESEQKYKAEFAKAVFEYFEKALDVPGDRLFLNMLGCECWGYKGGLI